MPQGMRRKACALKDLMTENQRCMRKHMKWNLQQMEERGRLTSRSLSTPAAGWAGEVARTLEVSPVPRR